MRRLADEYDAAQQRGEVARNGGDRTRIPDENSATVADIGLTHKEIHEARQVRDAEQADPERRLGELMAAQREAGMLKAGNPNRFSDNPLDS